MTWITTIAYEQATGKLKKLYERVKGPDNNVDNIMLAHSLRPHTMEGHMTLYKHVLHNSKNAIPKWFLEVLGVYTSLLNDCSYCVEHHFSGLKRLIKDDDKAISMRSALESNQLNQCFDSKEQEALTYCRGLTMSPALLTSDSVVRLRDVGFSDGEILEINQVVAYFNYANRTVLGLGINTDGDILGLSPGDSDDPENWNHG